MNPVFEDFRLDLERIKKILTLAEATGALRLQSFVPEAVADLTLRDVVVSLHNASQNAHAEMPILNGVMLLYLAGRFENYVREIFEDLINTLVDERDTFSELPKAMRENLVVFTAQVIASPRKFGHADNGVATFVRTLADNLSGQPLTAVNSKCLSITLENMRPDILGELFGRIGISKIWERFGQQLAIQQFFATEQPERATSMARTFLNNFMDLRNQIAHPSGALAWPSLETTLRHIEFCDVLGRVLMDSCTLWSKTLANVVDTHPKANIMAPG